MLRDAVALQVDDWDRMVGVYVGGIDRRFLPAVDELMLQADLGCGGCGGDA